MNHNRLLLYSRIVFQAHSNYNAKGLLEFLFIIRLHSSIHSFSVVARVAIKAMTLRPPIHMFPNYLKDVISQACPGTDLRGGGPPCWTCPKHHSEEATTKSDVESHHLAPFKRRFYAFLGPDAKKFIKS